MAQAVLKQDIKDKIKRDGILFGIVADSISRSGYTLPEYLRKDNPLLTTAGCLSAISKYLGISEGELWLLKDSEMVG